MSASEHEKQERTSVNTPMNAEGPEGASLTPPPFSLDSSSPLQMKSSLKDEGGDDGDAAAGDVDAGSGKVRARSQSSQGPLSPVLQAKLEGALGENFDNVKVNPNSQEAVQMNSHAFARGNEVHFAPGQFKPDTEKGQELIGHEFSHIKGQRHENIEANKEVNGQAVNFDPKHEAKADSDGKRVASFKLEESSSAVSVSSASSNSGPAQLKPALPGLLQSTPATQGETPAQLMPTLPSVVHGAMTDPGESPISLAYEALAMVLDADLNHESDQESITSPLSPHHPNYYEGSGISLLYWYACWDFYKARWESSSSRERQSFVNQGIEKIRDLILPRGLNVFERSRRQEMRTLINTEIRDRYRAVMRERGSLVLHSIPETRIVPEEETPASSGATPGTAAAAATTAPTPPRPRRRRSARRTEEQQATDREFSESAEELIESRTADSEEAGYRLIDDANSETESGRRYQASRLGTSAGQPASLGRGQLLTQLQVNRALGYFANNPEIAASITEHSGLTQENMQEISRLGRATVGWYNAITASGEDEIPEQTAAIRQMIADGHPERIIETYGDAFQGATHLPASDMQQMIDWQPIRSGGQRGELRTLRRDLSRQLTRLRSQRAMGRFRTLRRRPHNMSDRDATLAVLTEVSGGEAQAEGRPVPPREGLDQMISYIRDHGDLTFRNIAGASAMNQIMVDIYGDSHPNIGRLLAAHGEERNQLDANDLQAYATRPINGEDKNGWYTRGAMQSGHWAAFEELLPSLDIYSTQDRSLDNFDRALTVGGDMEGFEDLEGHSRNIFLGQMARMNHGGAGRFDAMYMGDEPQADYDARLAAWEERRDATTGRERRRFLRRNRRPRRTVRRRGGLSVFSGMSECNSVNDVRRFYQQIFAVENNQLATKVQQSLTRWTNNYLSLNGLNASQLDVFIPLPGARDLLPPPTPEPETTETEGETEAEAATPESGASE